MRKTGSLIAAFVAVLLAAGAFAAHAAVISEDIAYWYTTTEDSALLSIFNPDADWLQANLGNLIIKVQQTVYDPVQTEQILSRDGQKAGTTGYLYAYSVTNLNWEEGLTGFRVEWPIESLFTTVSNRVTPLGWSVNTSAATPEWSYNPATTYGIAPGETVGGFWAVAATGEDRVGSAGAASLAIGPNDIPYWLIGQTTVPVPDPAPIATMLVGLSGLGLTRLLRRR